MMTRHCRISRLNFTQPKVDCQRNQCNRTDGDTQTEITTRRGGCVCLGRGARRKILPTPRQPNLEEHDRLQSGEMSCSVPFVSLPGTCSLKSLFKARGGCFACGCGRHTLHASYPCTLRPTTSKCVCPSLSR